MALQTGAGSADSVLAMIGVTAHLGAWLVVARVLLVCMFPFSALDKIFGWDAALKQANSSWLPGGPVLLVLAMIIEFVTPICIVVGWYPGWAAFVLMSFCIATALLYHPFWKKGDFWAKGDSVDRNHFWDFTKNLGLAGGLLLIVLGAGFTGSA